MSREVKQSTYEFSVPNFKLIVWGSGDRPPKIRRFPLTFIIALTTLLHTGFIHRYDSHKKHGHIIRDATTDLVDRHIYVVATSFSTTANVVIV